MDRIVAVEINPETSQAEIFQRTADNSIWKHTMEYKPWLVSSFRTRGAKVRPLTGDNPIKYFHTYSSIESFREGRHQHPYGKAIVYEHLSHQFLGMNPDYRLFQGMRFDELVRFSFDIEATGLYADKDELLLVTVYATGWGRMPIIGTEQEMIQQLTDLIHCIDPDTIEGYNIFGYDLPFLAERAEKYDMLLTWGRDGSPIKPGKTWKFRVGSYERPVQEWTCYGRQVIDGLVAAYRYDANTQGQFENFGLKYLTKTLGISKEDRVYVERENMAQLWLTQRERVIEYALQDAEETYHLITMMVQPEFYLCTIIPDTFQRMLLCGSSMKINTLLVGDYLNEGWSIPVAPGEREEYEGGAVECRLVGVFNNVAKADVASLYPSIMLNAGALPRQDTLGVFYNTLKGLTAKRLAIKAQEKEAKTEDERAYLHGLNWSYKILINSFYGYLAVGMNFSDFDAAAKVTQVGRDIVTSMAEQVEAIGFPVIEVDTDGIYFQFAEGFPVEIIPDFLSLPDWVKVEVEDIYDSMISVKAKNYVLKKKGKTDLTFHGNSLRSRKDEQFGQNFIREIVKLLLTGETGAIEPLYRRYQECILNCEFTGTDICKRERISDKIDTPAKRRIKEAMGKDDKEGDYLRLWQREDGTLKKLEQFDKRCIDRFYYLERLYKFGQRLETVLTPLGIELPKVYKKDFYVMAGIEPPKRKKKEVAVVA